MIMLEADRWIRWMKSVFGPTSVEDIEERALRFGEEAIEFVQSLGITEEQVMALVNQVYAKGPGEPMQELGGTLVTLASLCAVTGMNAGSAYSTEADRIDSPDIIKKIQAKHRDKTVVSSTHEHLRMQEAVSIASISR